MIIDFEKIKETHIDNFKGGEKYIAAKMFVDNNNKIMFGYIIPGASIGLHTHIESSEIVYILKGKATIIYDNCEEIVTQGQIHYCPEGHSHALFNKSNENIEYLAIVPNHIKNENK